MFEWFTANADKIGAALIGFGSVYAAVRKFLSGNKEDKKPEEKKEQSNQNGSSPQIQVSPTINPNNDNTNTNNITLNNYLQPPADGGKQMKEGVEEGISKCKDRARILFIDDDAKFKVVSILKAAGWNHTKAVKDIKALDAEEVREAHIFFVDIQGVGKALDFHDQGLGLAYALKSKYPHKKVVIYSSDQNGDRFHRAFNIVDYQLYKNAEPYEFINLVEQLGLETFK
ncbi:hypothetical protein [Hymenobacter sp. B1770]|uniref:hypothetical protein n=1 Tax=Hymenobacter sp. B1770 TaxID=1718788 RepID=UPI003CF58EC1